MEKQQKKIETLKQEIAELVGADAIEKEILDGCQFEALLQETISLISSQLSFAKESKNSAEKTPSLNQQEAPIGTKTSSKAKLPKLTLPKSAGDPTEWTTFCDSFSSAIHLSEELSKIDKFQYLKSLLHCSGNCGRNYFGFAFEQVELQPCGRSSHEAVWK